MSILSLKPKQASVVWVEPHRLHAGGKPRPVQDVPLATLLAETLATLPPGPTRWVVDDAWIPALLMRDIVEVPSGAEAREAFFRWRYSQSLGTETPQFVQAQSLGENAWLLAGMAQERRDAWLQLAAASGHPIRSLIPRWLWLYNRLAPSRTVPGLLLSLCPMGDGTFSGTLAAWGRELILVRQWDEPAAPDTWNQERVLPTLAYLQRDARSPQELHLWGSVSWPESPLPVRIIQPEIPSQETC
jgi:hypothetical protein